MRRPVIEALRAALDVARDARLTEEDLRWLAGLLREMADDVDPDVTTERSEARGR